MEFEERSEYRSSRPWPCFDLSFTLGETHTHGVGSVCYLKLFSLYTEETQRKIAEISDLSSSPHPRRCLFSPRISLQIPFSSVLNGTKRLRGPQRNTLGASRSRGKQKMWQQGLRFLKASTSAQPRVVWSLLAITQQTFLLLLTAEHNSRL